MYTEPNAESTHTNALEETMNRRTMFIRTGSIAAVGGLVALSGTAHAAENADKSWNANADVISAAYHCVQESDKCLAHCISSFRDGSLMLAKCAGLVVETTTTCTALAKLAAHGSPSLKAMAQVCLDACTVCEAECRLHASHHEECKACAESCLVCIEACNKVIG